MYGYVWNSPYNFRDPLGNTVFGKCKQGMGPKEMAAIRGQLKKSCVSDYIDSSTITQEGEGIRFKITDQNAFLATLRKDKRFIYDTGYGGLHAKHVGAGHWIKRFWNWIRGKSNVKVVDIRSRAKGSNTLGPDSSSNGIVRSLQVVVGKRERIKGESIIPTLGYADLDCENPAEDFPSLLKHSFKVAGSGLKKAGMWVWKHILRQN